MFAWIPILAAAQEITPEDLKKAPGTGSAFHATDILIVIAMTLLVLTVLVLWAIFIRKPGEKAATPKLATPRPRETETEDGMIRKRKKRKRSRRDHRGRNPTLAEAGGLPPVRPDGSVPPV